MGVAAAFEAVSTFTAAEPLLAWWLKRVEFNSAERVSPAAAWPGAVLRPDGPQGGGCPGRRRARGVPPLPAATSASLRTAGGTRSLPSLFPEPQQLGGKFR